MFLRPRSAARGIALVFLSLLVGCPAGGARDGSTAGNGSVGDGGVLADSGQARSDGGAAGCTSNQDCLGTAGAPVCDPGTARCVQCAAAAQCPTGEDCRHDQMCHGTEACATDADCSVIAVCGPEKKCVVTSGRCNVARDCALTPLTPVCATATARCVQCLAASDCPGLATCGADGTCHLFPGTCLSEADCAGVPATPHCDLPSQVCVSCRSKDDCPDHPGQPVCDPARHVCAQCAVSSDCSASQTCQHGRCTASCKTDRDCGAAPNTRCCPETGNCNPIVAENADCDCEHPCPLDQGCFPGTCGQTPRKCRPGCYPGDYGSAADGYTGHKADHCATVNGVPAYCASLPLSEATTANRGGACAVSDTCNVLRQDCPNLPLDRTRPAGTDNPAVPHTCVPASPTTNQCLPAGSKPVGGTNCEQACGTTQNSCVKGSSCATPINSDGSPAGPSTCDAQCQTSINCPQGQVCLTLLGPGREAYQTGACGSPF